MITIKRNKVIFSDDLILSKEDIGMTYCGNPKISLYGFTLHGSCQKRKLGTLIAVIKWLYNK